MKVKGSVKGAVGIRRSLGKEGVFVYLFYLGGMLLPVTPPSFTVKDKNRNRVLSLVSGNEISLPETSGLCEISFSALLPMVKYPFCIYEGDFKDGMYFAKVLRGMKAQAKPLWFRVLRYGRRASTDIACVIDELTFKEDALNGGDITCDIVLRQYASYATRVIDTENGRVSVQSGERQVPKKAVISKGDTLWTIAKRYYGDGSKYMDIYSKNFAVIENAAKSHNLPCSENGRYIYEGTQLVL